LPDIIKGIPNKKFISFIIRPYVSSEFNIYADIPGHEANYGSFSNLIACLKIYFFARRYKNSIFQVFNIGPLYLLILQIAGVKNIIYSIHGTIYWKNSIEKKYRKALWKLINKRNVKLISNSEFSKKTFIDKIYCKAKIQVIYNPINGERFHPLFTKKNSGILKIIYAGRLAHGKGLEKWIELAFRIHKVIDKTQFVIFGSGPLTEMLRDIIHNYNADDFIFIEGFRKDIENVYSNADLLLYLSEYESFGNVVVESILCGTPVIALDIPSMREIFCNYPEFLISAENDLFQQIYDKLLNYNYLFLSAQKARDEFLVRFSVNEHINSLNKIYNSFND